MRTGGREGDKRVGRYCRGETKQMGVEEGCEQDGGEGRGGNIEK